MKFEYANSHMSLREIIHEVDPFEEMHLLERIELAMLLSAATGDVSVGTVGMCLDKENEIEIPACDENPELIDTEMVYNIVDEVAKDIIKERYE
jgi:hypothetical protein